MVFLLSLLTDNGLVFEVLVFPSSSGISGRDTATADYYYVSLYFKGTGVGNGLMKGGINPSANS